MKKINVSLNTFLNLKLLFVINSIAVFINLFGCSEENNIVCTAEARAGLNVFVTDHATNLPLVSGVLVTVKDGTYTDTLMNFQGTDGFAGAWERPGNYVITVVCAGYLTFVSDTVIVESDVCHVIPQTVYAQLRHE
ncbi:MAG TPA: hypothetical protein PK536_01205 [Ignavibacteria bacterium]|nr:hypothetical protein [Ignavibacteria bacterium]HRJ99544.1 hypothetical protein [Ignavibacteria bacterium]